MAITQNASAVGAHRNGAYSGDVWFAYNAGGADLLLIAAQIAYADAGVTGVAVTYNDTALTDSGAGWADAYTGGYRHEVSQWYMVTPPTGSLNVKMTWASQNCYAAMAATSWDGVDTTTPIRDAVAATGSSTSPSVTLTGLTAGDLVVDAMCQYWTYPSQTYTDDVPSVLIELDEGNDGSVWSNLHISQESAAGSSVTASWTLGNSENWATVGVALAVASAGDPEGLLIGGKLLGNGLLGGVLVC